MNQYDVEMTDAQAETLAHTINNSQSFRTKYVSKVAGKPVVVAKNAETGYEVHIHNPAHWDALVAQFGGASTMDDFGNAGARVMAHLDEQLTVLRKEQTELEDRSRVLTRKIDTAERQRWAVEQAMKVLNGEPARIPITAASTAAGGHGPNVGSFRPEESRPAGAYERLLNDAKSTEARLRDTVIEAPPERKPVSPKHFTPPGRPGSKRYPPLEGGLNLEGWIIRELRAAVQPTNVTILAQKLAKVRGVEPKGDAWKNMQSSVGSRLTVFVRKGTVRRVGKGFYEWVGGTGG